MRNPLRPKLRNGETTYGMWVTLESPSVMEVAVAMELDWCVIEMEHGSLDWGDVTEHIRVAKGTDLAAIVRVADLQRENVQRALDVGADGIIVPMIGDGQQLEHAYQLGRFPPRGVRGVGGERSVQWGLQWEEYLQAADRETMIIPLLETRDAVENAESILAVEGLEAVFFGPADMSASYGHLGQWEGPGVAEKILDVRHRAAERNIAGGILGRNADEVRTRRQQGFQMIGLGADVNLMIQSIRSIQGAMV